MYVRKRPHSASAPSGPAKLAIQIDFRLNGLSRRQSCTDQKSVVRLIAAHETGSSANIGHGTKPFVPCLSKCKRRVRWRSEYDGTSKKFSTK